MKRTVAREKAFILLFQQKFQPDCISEIIDDFFDENNTGSQKEYIKNTVLGVIDNLEKIDKIILEYAKGWTIDRMDLISLVALRLGCFEILMSDDLPNQIAVSEAVTLARRFGGVEITGFVNGILGNIQKDADVNSLII